MNTITIAHWQNYLTDTSSLLVYSDMLLDAGEDSWCDFVREWVSNSDRGFSDGYGYGYGNGYGYGDGYGSRYGYGDGSGYGYGDGNGDN